MGSARGRRVGAGAGHGPADAAGPGCPPGCWRTNGSASAVEPTPAGIGGALEAVSDIARNLEEMAELLEQLKDKQQQESPEVQQAAQQLADEQSQLEERGEQIADDVSASSAPKRGWLRFDAMEAADRAMERATEALEEGDAMSGGQRDATQRIGEAQDALQREMQQYQQMQQQTQQMQGQQQGGQNNEGGEDQDRQARDRPFEIPAPEAFETPEQYRRQLLEDGGRRAR